MKIIVCLALLTLVYTDTRDYYFVPFDGNSNPAARYSTVLATDGPNLMVFGGVSQNGTMYDGWKYSIAGSTWSNMDSTITILPSCSIQTPKLIVWIYGTSNTENGTKNTPKLLSYNIQKDQFCPQKSDPPSNFPTLGVSCASFNESMFFVFGGKFPNGSFSDKLFLFNVTLQHWSEISILSGNYPPPPRSGASLISDESGGLIMYGGYNENTIFDDMWYFNIETAHWTKQATLNSPKQRYMHTAVLGNQTMIIFGGNDGTNELNDVWWYSLEKKEWNQADPATLPNPRMGHSSIFHQGRMIIFGGMTKPNSMMNDMWQFIPELFCTLLPCVPCMNSQGCGWCSQLTDSKCVSGSELGQYVEETCDNPKHFSKHTCAPPLELSVWWFLSGGIAVGLLFGIGFFTGNNYCRDDDYVEIK